VFAFVALAFGGQFLAAEFIKLIVDRSRPDVLQLTGYAGGSFPSGHAVAGAAVFLAAALLLSRGRSRPVRSYLIGAAVGVAVAVAGTRVLLGVHWFTDVFAGLLVGWAWFALCSIAFGGRPLRFGAPVAQAEAVAASPSFGPARP
jgi:undecaprenyl-diphosphatase